MNRLTQKHSLQRNGATTVEIAILLPVFFLLLIGAYDATRVNMLRHTAQAAAYEGARRGVVPGASRSEIEAECRRIAASCGARDIRIRISPSVIRKETPEIEVTVEIPLRSNTMIASPFFGSILLEGKTKFTRESL